MAEQEQILTPKNRLVGLINKRVILLLLVIIGLSTLTYGGYNLIQRSRKAESFKRQITVTGVSEKDVEVTKVKIRFLTESIARDIETAKKSAETQTKDTVVSLEKIGIVSSSQAEGRITPTTNKQTQTQNFRYTNAVEVIVEKDKVAPVVTLLKVKGNQISEVEYLPENYEETISELKTQALEKARKEAEELAKKSNSKVGQVLSITQIPNPYLTEKENIKRAESAKDDIDNLPLTNTLRYEISVSFELK